MWKHSFKQSRCAVSLLYLSTPSGSKRRRLISSLSHGPVLTQVGPPAAGTAFVFCVPSVVIAMNEGSQPGRLAPSPSSCCLPLSSSHLLPEFLGEGCEGRKGGLSSHPWHCG